MGRPGYPMSHWHEVAAVYKTAGQSPAKAISEKYGVPITTAQRWTRVLYRERLIPPSFPGRAANATMQEGRLARVAEAVGVKPIDLYKAIRDHAEGDLRVSKMPIPDWPVHPAEWLRSIDNGS